MTQGEISPFALSNWLCLPNFRSQQLDLIIIFCFEIAKIFEIVPLMMLWPYTDEVIAVEEDRGEISVSWSKGKKVDF